jgi:hypothetical protein
MPQQVSLQLVKPYNHCINAMEQAIQMFKNWFIGALGTTGADFPIQLWENFNPQIQDSINLLCCSQKYLDCSAYKTLEGPYAWNHYLTAPSGTKAIIYDDPNTCAAWAPHGLDAWLLSHLRTTIDAICTMTPKPAAIAFPIQPTSFHRIALHRPTCTKRIFKNCQQSYNSH